MYFDMVGVPPEMHKKPPLRVGRKIGVFCARSPLVREQIRTPKGGSFQLAVQ